MEDYQFGECPICRQGLLIAVKDPVTQQLLVICDDCESQWRSPDEAKSSKNVILDEVRRVETVTLEEIEAAGWIR